MSRSGSGHESVQVSVAKVVGCKRRLWQKLAGVIQAFECESLLVQKLSGVYKRFLLSKVFFGCNMRCTDF